MSPTRIVAALVLITSILIGIYAAIHSLSPAGALALTLFTIGFWATGVLPEYLTALIFFTTAMLFGMAPAGVIFSGFQSTVLWLVFGGLVLGVAIKRTGLGERVADRLSLKFGKTYVSIIAGMVTIGVALSFIMPSAVGRIVLLVPVARSLANRFGFDQGSQGRTGIMLAVSLGSFFPAFGILPANVPNLVLTGAAETLYQFTPLYGEYLWLHFPVLGLLKAAVIIALILFLFPDQPQTRALDESQRAAITSDERILALLLVVTVSLWITDFLHHISPAWIALGAGAFCLFPLIGLVPKQSFQQEINYGTLFFLAGVIGLGNLLSYSGLGNKLAKALLTVLPLRPGALALNFASLSITAIAIGLATNMPSVPAVLAPLAGEMAKAAGLPVETVLMTQVVGFSSVFLPHQAAPLVVTVQLSGIKAADLIKLCFLLAALTILVLLPIDFIWWRFIGWI